MNFDARRVTLEDWPAVKWCWQGYCASPSAIDRKTGEVKIKGSVSLIRSLFLASLTTDCFHMFGLFDGFCTTDPCSAIVTLQEFTTPDINDEGQGVLRQHCYLRSTFSIPGTAREGMDLLDGFMVNWAKSRGHKQITGQCRPHIPERAVGRYGFKFQHVTVGKEI